MRDFRCPTCGQRLTFENSVCLSCGSDVGFSLRDMAFLVISGDEGGPQQGKVAARDYQLCANLHLAQCNWLVDVQPVRQLCVSCRLTRTRPRDGALAALAAFANAERAKRRLVAELHELRLPVVGRRQDSRHGLAFDLLSSSTEPVVTGHHEGIVTVDLAEGDDLHRERIRLDLDEPYRTLLGHFRHEVGHYYFFRLIEPRPDRLADFTALFGDPRTDYDSARSRYYQSSPSAGWEQEHVSAYAAMHPAEDWAETFAHYLHIRSALDTAAAYGLAPATGTYQHKIIGPSAFDTLIEMWLPLSWSLNMVNRAMGKPDLYPFVLPAVVLGKMRLIHDVVTEVAAAAPRSIQT